MRNAVIQQQWTLEMRKDQQQKFLILFINASLVHKTDSNMRHLNIDISADMLVYCMMCIPYILGLAGGGVNFSPNNLQSAMLCTCNQNSTNTTPMFWLLLSSAATAPFKAVCPNTPPQKAARVGVSKRWGGDPADPNDPKRRYIYLSHTVRCCAQQQKWGEGKWGRREVKERK